jgi:hypothetical protein
MTPAVAAGVFLLYGALNGITFSLIFACGSSGESIREDLAE